VRPPPSEPPSPQLAGHSHAPPLAVRTVNVNTIQGGGVVSYASMFVFFFLVLGYRNWTCSCASDSCADCEYDKGVREGGYVSNLGGQC